MPDSVFGRSLRKQKFRRSRTQNKECICGLSLSGKLEDPIVGAVFYSCLFHNWSHILCSKMKISHLQFHLRMSLLGKRSLEALGSFPFQE